MTRMGYSRAAFAGLGRRFFGRLLPTLTGERGCVNAPRAASAQDGESSSLTGPVLGALTQPRSPAIENGARLGALNPPSPLPLSPRKAGGSGKRNENSFRRGLRIRWRSSSAAGK